MTVVIGVGLLILLIALGVPVGFALGLTSIAALAQVVPANTIWQLMTNVIHQTTANNVLMTIPMFVLMAEFLTVGGVAEDMLLACNRALRKVRGGMAMACILGGVIHAAATGSSSASAASLARASYPAMMKAGYASRFALGTVAIAGTLAAMIPPSIAFILFGLVTGASVGKLFVAGLLPALMTACGYLLTISLTLRLKPDYAPSNARLEEDAAKGGSRGNVWPMAALITVVIGGLYSGVATPSEISTVGALGALIISSLTGRMTLKAFVHATGGTLRIITMIMVILFGAQMFGFFVSYSKVTEVMLHWIAMSGFSHTMVVVVMVFTYLVMGAFLDQGSIIILTAPISTALMVGLGYSPIWWGVVIIKTAEIGFVHPPLGVTTFVVASATKTNLQDNYIGVIPYIATELILLVILVAWPQISLLLVN